MDSAREGAGTTSVRVFLLDDHEMVRRGVRDMLTQAGGFAVVGESGSAVEAAELLPVLRPDVALLDVRLPDGCGIEVCRQLRTAVPTVRVVILAPVDDDEVRREAARAGAAAIVAQRITGSELVDTVRGVAAGHRLACPSASARPREGDPRLAALTGQEQRVLKLIADGLTNRQIGERLGIGENTVKNYVTGVLAKLGLRRRTQAAVVEARARGY